MSSSLSCARLTAVTVAAVVIQITGLALFVFGFFPVKPTLSGVSGVESFHPPWDAADDGFISPSFSADELKSLYQDLSDVPAQFDRLILMVIDGLPAEFVLGKNGQPPPQEFVEAMPYTQSLMWTGEAIGYHAVASPPTVTMPRLKALVSGAIGGFLDVAFNFNTQAFLDDNILGQLLRVGFKMLMFGDETWLKLFPESFARCDGVSSFYVKDTVQVDLNVSRHLDEELYKEDWDAMILHYLGLDHIGHIGGRNSDLMIPKLREMDQIIKTIHLSTQEFEVNDHKRTLMLVVSDHGMTYSGNHGGSSFEETDTLALFVGPKSSGTRYGSATSSINQVDIPPTLALLFGVPIPKNNVGIVIADVLKSLSGGQQLRALELNSWQLLRLLQAQLPGLSCGNSLCVEYSDYQATQTGKSSVDADAVFCSSYCKAHLLHRSWKSKKVTWSATSEDFTVTQLAYYEFIRTASDWLSHKASDKCAVCLTFGVAAMLVSCLIVFHLLFKLCRHITFGATRCQGEKIHWHLDDYFSLAVILALVASMGSSSMVEEEQYIWHFFTSSMSLVLLRSAAQQLPANTFTEHSSIIFRQFSSIILLLVFGRILRGWHQGGVNWTYLPDISKWLEQAGDSYIHNIQLASGFLAISLSISALFLLRKRRKFVLLIGLIYIASALLVMSHLIEHTANKLAATGYGATLMAQIIYTIISISTAGIVLLVPWLMPIQISGSYSTASNSKLHEKPPKCSLLGLRDSIYITGWAYISFWCLLQLVLQQAINSFPMLLVFMQILASLLYYSTSKSRHKPWVEIATLYYLGMTGHFSLGNSNTLATIDVAGAFIGISEHSTLLSGTLMFMITYASPFTVLFSLVMYISVKNGSLDLDGAQSASNENVLMEMLCFPCLVPLGLNSVVLTAYTIVLLAMRNHLFIWSVFSPKYLYVCATTICIYLGIFIVAATTVYIYSVINFRTKKLSRSQ
uniref:GPI ethanolamine phosphate transferase 2 C-terminal domain-containing protein n=1 Tax=Kalanchoe fedtschenkoi TaxID=63787 RepID=A0A7N0TJ25_KALFE